MLSRLLRSPRVAANKHNSRDKRDELYNVIKHLPAPAVCEDSWFFSRTKRKTMKYGNKRTWLCIHID